MDVQGLIAEFTNVGVTINADSFWECSRHIHTLLITPGIRYHHLGLSVPSCDPEIQNVLILSLHRVLAWENRDYLPKTETRMITLTLRTRYCRCSFPNSSPSCPLTCEYTWTSARLKLRFLFWFLNVNNDPLWRCSSFLLFCVRPFINSVTWERVENFCDTSVT